MNIQVIGVEVCPHWKWFQGRWLEQEAFGTGDDRGKQLVDI